MKFINKLLTESGIKNQNPHKIVGLTEEQLQHAFDTHLVVIVGYENCGADTMYLIKDKPRMTYKAFHELLNASIPDVFMERIDDHFEYQQEYWDEGAPTRFEIYPLDSLLHFYHQNSLNSYRDDKRVTWNQFTKYLIKTLKELEGLEDQDQD